MEKSEKKVGVIVISIVIIVVMAIAIGSAIINKSKHNEIDSQNRIENNSNEFGTGIGEGIVGNNE